MTDIVERLRRQVIESPYEGFVSPLEAADEIERLEADNERMRAALREIADHADLYGPPDQGDALALMHVARRALEGKDDA